MPLEKEATRDPLTEQIIGAAIEVHRTLGPGLLESVYEQCMCYELSLRNVLFERQKAMPVRYKDILIDCGFRVDIFVAGLVVVELKVVEASSRVHEAQLLTYMKLSGCHRGLLINFNVTLMKDGIRRYVL